MDERIKIDVEKRVQWIRDVISASGAKGIAVGNSGGKDSALVLILCKMAMPEVLGVMMPCESSQNYGSDKHHAALLAEKFNIENIEVDLTEAKKALRANVGPVTGGRVPMAFANINPRLRMTALYTIAQDRGYLVAGTGNFSEALMGYFTKWGDGAYDFNPVADLTATQIFAYLKELGAPSEIIEKAPSAGLYEGQTDEAEMGVTYAEIDKFAENLKKGITENPGIGEEAYNKILKVWQSTAHKRAMPLKYGLF